MKLFNTTLALTAAVTLGMAAASATARTDISVDLRLGGHPAPPAVYEQTTVIAPGYQRVWVPAQYQTVTENTWHEPATQDQVSKQWVTDRYVIQPVQTIDQYGRPITVNQPVLVEPAHWQETHTPIVVQAGYWGPETKQVLMSDGYWQTVGAPPVVYVAPVPPPYRYGPREDVRVNYDDRRDHWHR